MLTITVSLWGLLCLVAVTPLTVASPAKMKYCGNKLADIIEEVCQGHHNSRKHPISPNQSKMRQRIGIVDECCKNPCDRRTIRTYCSQRVEDSSEEEDAPVVRAIEETTQTTIVNRNQLVKDVPDFDRSEDYTQVRLKIAAKNRWGERKCHCRRRRAKPSADISSGILIGTVPPRKRPFIRKSPSLIPLPEDWRPVGNSQDRF